MCGAKPALRFVSAGVVCDGTDVAEVRASLLVRGIVVRFQAPWGPFRRRIAGQRIRPLGFGRGVGVRNGRHGNGWTIAGLQVAKGFVLVYEPVSEALKYR